MTKIHTGSLFCLQLAVLTTHICASPQRKSWLCLYALFGNEGRGQKSTTSFAFFTPLKIKGEMSNMSKSLFKFSFAFNRLYTSGGSRNSGREIRSVKIRIVTGST